MPDWKAYAIGSLTIGLLVSLGFNVAPDDNYFCRASELSKKCDRISSTGSRCYPLPGTTKGYKDCSSGWELLAKDKPAVESESYARISANGKEWNCPCGMITAYSTCSSADGSKAYLGEIA